MHTITDDEFFGHTAIKLSNDIGDEAIITTQGATLESLILNKQALIEGHHNKEEFLACKSARSAFLVPYPNRINKGTYEYKGKTHQLPIAKPKHPHAIHGFVKDKPFEIREKNTGEQASITFSYIYREGEQGYPFPFTYNVTYTLHEHKLTIEPHIINTGKSTLPIGWGWHPYFTLGPSIDNLSIHISAPMNKILVDKAMIPTGKSIEETGFIIPLPLKNQAFDTCFVLDERHEQVNIMLTDGKQHLVITQHNLPFIQIYTPKGRKSIAIEPMTCPPDVFNNKNNLMELAPKKEWSTTVAIALE